jgi:hypothetical protein
LTQRDDRLLKGLRVALGRCPRAFSLGNWIGSGDEGMLVLFSSLAIGFVLGWHLMHVRAIPLWIWTVRIVGALSAVFLLGLFSAAHTFLGICGLAVGLASHAFVIALIRQREKEA